ncbi:hypothetical protein TWF106_007806 [Orbilia oligospora]|uniref:alanine--glyoxylate transaminase n=1 Tax=Orbilia oligospora TaxID=2813651 RepID=A0A7C8P9C4_ORBOL|nr:hypothetical protein TWF788_010258 [Orbilia oligospora]KAF3217843.1 hypothetical protein TWF106_007806 [Orbilia oligospora]
MHMLAAARGTGRLVNSSSRRCRIEVRSLQADRMDADGRQLLRLTSSATHSRSLSTAAVAPRRPSTAPTTIYTNTSATSYNTPSSSASARLSQLNNHIPNKVSNISTALKYSTTATTTPDKMSAQAEHPTVLIPGPIEFDDAVLQAMSTPSESHVGMPFVHVFGDTLTQLRQLFITSSPDSQPLILSGSGTLGWDVVASNIIEPGDEVLVLHTGYFGDSFSDCLATYGAKPTQLGAPIGSRPSPQEIEEALKGKKYKAVTITHTDTSTGVLSDPKEVAEVVKRVSPETLVVVDGVCSVGCEEIRFDEWGLDVVLTASQKAVGVPAGLSIMMLSGRAIEAYKSRKAKKPSYFATPSPQLVRALNTSLTQILSVPLSQRFEEHKAASKKIKDAVASFGLKQLASEERFQAHGMTAVWLPEGLTPADILPHTAKEGVVFAGGLHKQAATKYIRIGSMGVSVTNPALGHIDKAINALKTGLVAAGYQLP